MYLVLALAVASVIFAILYNTTSYWPFKAPLWVICLDSVVVTFPLIWSRRFPSQIAWIQTTIFVTAQVRDVMEPGVTQIIIFMGVYAIRRLAEQSRCGTHLTTTPLHRHLHLPYRVNVIPIQWSCAT